MQPIKNISIPVPCHEDWQQMTPVAQGRHCQSCCKTVVDFTAMSNADIINYLASNTNTCGRISNPKMVLVNNQLEIQNRKQFTWKGLIAAASLSVLFPAVNALAQSAPKTEQPPSQPEILGKIAMRDTTRLITIKGIIKAHDDGLPVVAAIIKTKGTNINTYSSVKGEYKLEVPANADSIEVSFIGYKTSRIKFDPLIKEYNVVLEPQMFFENQVIVTAGMMVVAHRPPFYKRWWYRLTHLF